MNKLTGTILTLPKMSGNVGAKTIHIGGKGDDGATFTPSVSADGIISWTNDKDLPNPEPVNIKGTKGDKGDKGDRGQQGVQGVQGERGEQGQKGDKGDRGEQGIQGIQGEKGEKGDTGAQGAKGDKGETGANGVSATHSWNGTVLTVTSASGTSSADLKGEPGKDGNPGKDGSPGSAGKDGTSVTHSWSGTTLSVTSASGTSSANLKGEKGDKGDKGDSIKGDKGDTGAAGTSVTVKSVSESTADGGNNVVTFSDGKTMTVKNGKQGAPGYTPQKFIDYWTDADQEAIVQQVITALGTPVFGRVDADNNITLTGELVDGMYTLWYEDKNGKTTKLCTYDTSPEYINWIKRSVEADDTPYNGGQGWKANTRLNSSGLEASYDSSECIGFIPFVPGDIIRFGNITFLRKSDIDRTKFYFVQYDANKTMLRNWVVSGFNDPIKAGWVFEDENYNIYQINTGDGVGDGDLNIHPDARYFRINADEINADSIITINEPIV